MQLLTATGCRPQAWSICERLMAAQTYAGPVHWIVVDDGPEQQPITFERDGWQMQVVRPQPAWRPGANTQARNLLAGLDAARRDAPLVIIEDDDWYAPDWLQVVNEKLQRAELVGEDRSRYYNLRTRVGRDVGNTRHASLCSTAMRGGAIDTFRQVCRTNIKFIDMRLWRTARSRYLFSGHRVVGIKGLPGRPGIGVGHKETFTGFEDHDGALLRKWVGDAADEYLQVVQAPALEQ